jgi:hypothetical protein
MREAETLIPGAAGSAAIPETSTPQIVVIGNGWKFTFKRRSAFYTSWSVMACGEGEANKE